MLLHSLPFLTLIATCIAFSIPQNPSILQLPSQNQTLLPQQTQPNTTQPLLTIWPPTPFRRHLGEDTDTEIISRTPSSSADPTSEMGVLGGISVIKATVRGYSRLNMITKYEQTEGPVTFRFRAKGDAAFRGSEVAELLDQLWVMTNLYGKARIYGRLVRGDEDIAFFVILLENVSVGVGEVN